MRMNATDLMNNERISNPGPIDTNGVILETETPTIMLNESDGSKLVNCDDDTVLDASIFKICFRDAATYSELNSLITRCVKNALFYLQKSVICTEDPSNCTVIFNETSKADDGLFIVDSARCEAPEILNVVPEYSRSEVEVNDKISDDRIDEAITTSKTTQNTCFNCDGDHAIKDCLKPKDLAKIKQNRSKFTSNKVSYERYHVDVEQRFGHLVAGEISKDLRSALGLRSKELPNHIYRMRMIGYPPGWLEYAKVLSSGLTMFDSEGKDEEKDDDDEYKYDLKKLISYPGFNVEAPHGTLDESRNYRAPPMNPNQSKDCMIEYLRSKSTKAYKRKAKLSTDVTVLEPADMDIDEDSDDDVRNKPLIDRVAQLYGAKAPPKTIHKVDPVASFTVIPLESQSPLSEGELLEGEPLEGEPLEGEPLEGEPKREDSPSLDDLNERKKRLLVALDDSTVSISTLEKKPLEDDSLIDDILALQEDSTLESSGIIEENGDTTTGDIDTPSTNSPPVTPHDNLIGKSPLHTSKGTVRGTPVIKGISPYSILPNGANWASGVTNLMDFENLPESVGKYEKMRTLLGKVRAKVKQIQYEDED